MVYILLERTLEASLKTIDLEGTVYQILYLRLSLYIMLKKRKDFGNMCFIFYISQNKNEKLYHKSENVI